MGKVYQIVREVMQGTLNRTPGPAISSQATESEDNLSEALEDLDKFADRIRRLKAAVSDNRAVALTKTKHAEQVIESLKANIKGLDARVKETEESFHNQNVGRQKMEESLRTEIDNLQGALTEKEESLQTRISEVNALRSKIDVLAEQVSQAELAVSKARAEAANKVQEAEQVTEGLKANIIVLEAALKAKLCQGAQNGVDSTGSSISALDQDRNEPATDLDGHSQLQRKGRTASMAQAFANLQAQAIGRITETAREIVSPEAFVRIVTEFSEFANVIESMASLIVRDHVRTLGESMEQFPQKRLSELLESLSKEISDNKLRTDFRERFGDKTLG